MMSLLEFYVNLRKEIFAVIGGVEDSGYSFRWDNTTPNWITKSKLKTVFEKLINHSANFGVYIINRHSDCGNPKHDQNGSDGYVMDRILENKISYRDSRFNWSDPIDQGEILCKCPCSESNLTSKHHVIQDVIFDASANLSACKNIESIIYDQISF